MRYRVLGGTGIEVSIHCLGAMMFGAVGNPDHDDCVRIIHAALDQGINFVDTADMYSAGESEKIVGKALRGRRDDVVLATKVREAVTSARWHHGGADPAPVCVPVGARCPLPADGRSTLPTGDHGCGPARHRAMLPA